MKRIHSFFLSVRSKKNCISTARFGLGGTFIAMYVIAIVVALLGFYNLENNRDNVVAVQARTNYRYSAVEGKADVVKQLLQEETSQITIEEQLTNYVQMSTLDGMNLVVTKQIAKVEEQEALIDTAIQEEVARTAEKARVDAETARMEEVLLRQQEQKEQEEATKQAMVDQKVQEKEEAEAAEAAAQAALLEQQIKEQKEKEAKEALARSKKVIQLSSSERDILERIVHAEAGNQDLKGKMLVANVVLNRVKSPQFPNTVKAVVFEHSGSTYQFSPAKSGSVNRVKVSDSTREAVSRVLQGEDYSNGALYFVARNAANKASLSWFDRKLTKLFTHGGHTFYK